MLASRRRRNTSASRSAGSQASSASAPGPPLEAALTAAVSQEAVEIAVGRDDIKNQHVFVLDAIQDDVPADRKNP